MYIFVLMYYTSGQKSFINRPNQSNAMKKTLLSSDKGITRMTRDDAVINHMPEVRRKFSDIYLEYKNFITEEEFNAVWDLAENKI